MSMLLLQWSLYAERARVVPTYPSHYMPGINFTRIRNEITMADVLRQLDFEPVSLAGDQARGVCPVHGSTRPQGRSFSVNLRSGRYYCHKCHSQGNQLELWAAVHKLPIYEAAVYLCQKLGRDVPWIVPSPEQEQKEKRHR